MNEDETPRDAGKDAQTRLTRTTQLTPYPPPRPPRNQTQITHRTHTHTLTQVLANSERADGVLPAVVWETDRTVASISGRRAEGACRRDRLCELRVLFGGPRARPLPEER